MSEKNTLKHTGYTDAPRLAERVERLEALLLESCVYEEGGIYRWRIVRDGREYVDGGNYLTREQAEDGLLRAIRAILAKK